MSIISLSSYYTAQLFTKLAPWTIRYILDPDVSFGPFGTSWTLRYLLDVWVPLRRLGTSWTFWDLLDHYVHLGNLGTSQTFRYLLDLQATFGLLGTAQSFRYLFAKLGIYWTFIYLYNGLMELTIYMVLTKIHGIAIVLARTNGKYIDSWY